MIMLPVALRVLGASFEAAATRWAKDVLNFRFLSCASASPLNGTASSLAS